MLPPSGLEKNKELYRWLPPTNRTHLGNRYGSLYHHVGNTFKDPQKLFLLSQVIVW